MTSSVGDPVFVDLFQLLPLLDQGSLHSLRDDEALQIQQADDSCGQGIHSVQAVTVITIIIIIRLQITT